MLITAKEVTYNPYKYDSFEMAKTYNLSRNPRARLIKKDNEKPRILAKSREFKIFCIGDGMLYTRRNF